MIAFEAEVPQFLLWGFSLIWLAALMTLVILFLRSRNRNLLFFIGQMIFLALAFWNMFRMLMLPRPHPMLTEECSWLVGLAGVCWAVSMGFMLAGVYRLLKKSKVLYQI